jgi:hypothetical protein
MKAILVEESSIAKYYEGNKDQQLEYELRSSGCTLANLEIEYLSGTHQWIIRGPSAELAKIDFRSTIFRVLEDEPVYTHSLDDKFLEELEERLVRYERDGAPVMVLYVAEVRQLVDQFKQKDS